VCGDNSFYIKNIQYEKKDFGLLMMLLVAVPSSMSNAQSTDNSYNVDLAKKTGADDYGMKKYVMVLSKKRSSEYYGYGPG
jgi:hypothetical protein